MHSEEKDVIEIAHSQVRISLLVHFRHQILICVAIENSTIQQYYKTYVI